MNNLKSILLGVLVGVVLLIGIEVTFGINFVGKTKMNYGDDVHAVLEIVEESEEPVFQKDYILAGLTLSSDFQHYLESGVEKGWWTEEFLTQTFLDNIAHVYVSEFKAVFNGVKGTEVGQKIADLLAKIKPVIASLKEILTPEMITNLKMKLLSLRDILMSLDKEAIHNLFLNIKSVIPQIKGLIANIKVMIGNIFNIFPSISNKISGIFYTVNNLIINILSEVSSIKHTIVQKLNEIKEKLITTLNLTETKIEQIKLFIEDALINLEVVIPIIEAKLEQLINKLNNLAEQIPSIQENVNQLIVIINETIENLNQIVINIKDKIEEIQNNIDIENIEQTITNIINILNSEIFQNILIYIEMILNGELTGNIQEQILAKIEEIKNIIVNSDLYKLIQKINSLTKEQIIQYIKDKIKNSDLYISIQEQIEQIKLILQEIETTINNIINKIPSIQEAIKQIKDILNKINNLIDNPNFGKLVILIEMIQDGTFGPQLEDKIKEIIQNSEIAQLVKEIVSKLNNITMEDIKNYIQGIYNGSDLYGQIQALKADIQAKIEELNATKEQIQAKINELLTDIDPDFDWFTIADANGEVELPNGKLVSAKLLNALNININYTFDDQGNVKPGDDVLTFGEITIGLESVGDVLYLGSDKYDTATLTGVSAGVAKNMIDKINLAI